MVGFDPSANYALTDIFLELHDSKICRENDGN